MDSNFFHTLRKLLEKLPGIGPRQANRFLWAMLDFSEDEQKDLARAIAELPKHLRRCAVCSRAFNVRVQAVAANSDEKHCSFCFEYSKREKNKIMVIEKDNDILNIERSGAYGGLYHVLGGMIDPLDENPIVRERIKKLYERVGKNHPNYEVILALSPTKTGEFTSNYITKVLEPLAPKITRLARGLSTGVELEYADEMTIRHALDNRR
ncbi:recombination protein RecR [Candidatus Giovannonibacteria bacterium RIFCSPHIGHO2_01_FULL_45_33]|uniref:Recombination protein RecR n=1 Tax=Candidatus Giovannonibacteria bacterium RIFCSPLOWO2_01_FULL_45_34 TaxID=1798351 RepID=A0A1F5X098_9BACT|nr:MAG: recombination protein RecR [Candidatus Giovannonibacteria bacterium RIFCSPHIGHO2_01_FULL_45_33]OGF70275.1 MAG: recombination protein RecR [Candidatus Giovannonibacteria bacterium RIFCSPHIGHO2_02_FULL_44_11]OGF81315.1 MAG: recombination protein RecR [Candidatus Giovannonibacteria bacterium RIFCSPLOWO2_01_FULL_45_34]